MREHTEEHATDLRLFSAWCQEADLSLFNVRRAHLELFGRWMGETGRLGSFYNPALNVRRPKVDYESRSDELNRTRMGRSHD